MSMKAIGLTAERAEELLVHLAAHVPADVPIGRPLIVQVTPDCDEEMILTTDPDAWWFAEPTSASRLVALPGGKAALTQFRAGLAVSHVIGGS